MEPARVSILLSIGRLARQIIRASPVQTRGAGVKDGGIQALTVDSRRSPIWRSTPPRPTPRELLSGLLGVFRRRPDGPPPPPELDEHGFPRDWRRDLGDDEAHHELHRRLLARSAVNWPIFERWCQERGLRAFPASVETALRFVRDAPVRGSALYETWLAINNRHEAYYWNEDADPTYLLERGYGVLVAPDGSVKIPGRVLRQFGA